MKCDVNENVAKEDADVSYKKSHTIEPKLERFVHLVFAGNKWASFSEESDFYDPRSVFRLIGQECRSFGAFAEK